MWNDPSSMTTSWDPWLAPPFGPFQWLTTADNPDEALRTLALALRKKRKKKKRKQKKNSTTFPPWFKKKKKVVASGRAECSLSFQRAKLNIKKKGLEKRNSLLIRFFRELLKHVECLLGTTCVNLSFFFFSLSIAFSSSLSVLRHRTSFKSIRSTSKKKIEHFRRA